MQRFFIYGKRRRKAPDVSDVQLPDVALVKDVEMRQKAANVIPAVIKSMPALI